MAGVGFDGAVQLPDGAGIQVGGSVIQWRPVERVDREWLRAPDGRIEFTRRFHRARVPEPVVVEMPAALPETSRGVLALVISLGGPIVLGLVIFVATGNAAFLWIMLLSPLAAGVQQLGFDHVVITPLRDRWGRSPIQRTPALPRSCGV